MEIGITLIVSAFIAGFLMFLAPCTLPLVPAYIAFISGVKVGKENQLDATARRRILVNAIAFVVGFSTIFILFGILAGLFAVFTGALRPILTQLGGFFIIVFGLMMLDIIPLTKFFRVGSLPVPNYFKPGNPVSASAIGATFALGWTPCVGPVLASVLLLATTSTTVYQGALLLTIFSIGLAIPFLITALLYSRASHIIVQYAWLAQVISTIGALFLIFIGFLLITNNFGLTVQYGYILFEQLGLTTLFNHF